MHRGRALGQRRARADRELFQRDRLVGLLEAVDERAALVACGAALLTALIATMAGYGFARFRFPGSGVVFALVLVTMMIPFQALLTPLFLEMHTPVLTNNLAGLALFYTTFNLPFGVFVMRNTFLQIPGSCPRRPRSTARRPPAP